MSESKQSNNPRVETNAPIMPVAVGFGAYHVFKWIDQPVLEPVYAGAILNPLPALAVGVMCICGITTTTFLLIRTADWLEKIAARKPTGRKGTAEFAAWKDIQYAVLDYRYGWDAWWGVYAGHDKKARGRPIMAPYKSNVVTFGTAGSGKGIGVVLPTSMSLAHAGYPQLSMDFKTANAPMLKPAFEKLGHSVKILNIGGLCQDVLGESDCYNPLNNANDCLMHKDGISEINDLLVEVSFQLYPDPESGSGENKYFYDGTRNMLCFMNRQSMLTYGDTGNFSHSQKLTNRTALMRECMWITGELADADVDSEDEEISLPPMPLEQSGWALSGLHEQRDVDAFIAHHRAQAAELLAMIRSKDSNAFESFLTGAQQALEPFSATGKAHRVMSHSTFRFGDMKEYGQVTHVFICADPAKSVSQNKIASLLQWCAFTEWKRHPNKNMPVKVISDECTNMKIHDLPGLQTWGREFSITWHGFVQSVAAYRSVYGKNGLETLLSETEIKQFLPHQRNPEMLALIQNLLGNRSIIAQSSSGGRDAYGIKGFNLSEDAMPLMDKDQIRQTPYTILFIKDCKAVLTRLPSIAAIHPWRRMLGINPFYGKRYLEKVTVWLGKRRYPLHWKLRWKIQSIREHIVNAIDVRVTAVKDRIRSAISRRVHRITNTLIFWRKS